MPQFLASEPMNDVTEDGLGLGASGLSLARPLGLPSCLAVVAELAATLELPVADVDVRT